MAALEPLPPPDGYDMILQRCDDLLKDVRNFSLHAELLKKMLDLKDRQNGYDMYLRPDRSPRATPQPETDPNETILRRIKDKLDELSIKLDESHRSGFCLAYNIQCLHKQLTGNCVEVNCTKALYEQIQRKYNHCKTLDTIVRFDFSENRKLLRHLRRELSESRSEWRRKLLIKKPLKDTQDEKTTWKTFLNNHRHQKQSSIESGFGSVSGSENGEMLDMFSERREQIEKLEDECYEFLTGLNKQATAKSDSDGEQEIDDESDDLIGEYESYDDVDDSLEWNSFDDEEEEIQLEPIEESNDDVDEIDDDDDDANVNLDQGDSLVIGNLRRRAFDTFISRLRDEKILHERKENELVEKLESIRGENVKLSRENEKFKSTIRFHKCNYLVLLCWFLFFLLIIKFFC